MRTRHFTPRVPVLYYESASDRKARLARDRHERMLTVALSVVLALLLALLYFTIRNS